MMNSYLKIGGMFLFLATTALPSVAQTEKIGALRAAAGSVDITPARTAYMAGYGSNRKSLDAHDRLMAKCLVLESGEVRVAIVSADLIGIPRYQSEKIRSLVKSIKPENLYLAATHTHSGPDTVGQWGPAVNISGVDQEWMTGLRQKIATLVDQTSAVLKPAAIRFAETDEIPKISKNIRIHRFLDTTLSVMQLISKSDGKPISTLVNFACHPEILNNRHMTADFPHWLYETVEGEKGIKGGVCLYLNGAQGGMITADYDELTSPKGENWAAAESIGKALGFRALEILKDSERIQSVSISADRRVYRVPLENSNFKALIKLKVFPQDVVKNGMIETEVNRIQIGTAEILTFPGEVLPNIGLYLRNKMSGKPKFQFGLTGDFLGYILTPEDFGLKLYEYESSVSVGSEMEPLMAENLLSLMKKKR